MEEEAETSVIEMIPGYRAWCPNHDWEGAKHDDRGEAVKDLQAHKDQVSGNHRASRVVYDSGLLMAVDINTEELELFLEKEELAEALSSDGFANDSAAPKESLQSWTYEVERKGDNLIFSFCSTPHYRKIRHYGKTAMPLEYYVKAGDDVVVSPGQWLMGFVVTRWSYLSDADNR